MHLLALAALAALIAPATATYDKGSPKPDVDHHDNKYGGERIYYNNNKNKCLVAEGKWEGAKIVYDNCKDDECQRWDLDHGKKVGYVRLYGTDYCVDAGDYSKDICNGSKLYLKKCSPHRVQWWWYPYCKDDYKSTGKWDGHSKWGKRTYDYDHKDDKDHKGDGKGDHKDYDKDDHKDWDKDHGKGDGKDWDKDHGKDCDKGKDCGKDDHKDWDKDHGKDDHKDHGKDWDKDDKDHKHCRERCQRFEVAGKPDSCTRTDFCIDLTDGKRVDGTQLQIWKCYPGNPFQVWDYWCPT